MSMKNKASKTLKINYRRGYTYFKEKLAQAHMLGSASMPI